MSPPSCLVCGGIDTRFFFAGPLEKFTRAMGRSEGVSYWACSGCSVAFQHPQFSDDEYRAFYEGVQRSDAVGYRDDTIPPEHLEKKRRDAEVKWRLFDGLGLLEAVRGKRVLEVGPAEGTLLSTFAARGFSVSGVEPFDRYARHAREALKLDVKTGYFGPGVVPDASVDLVLIDNVLEHVPEPVATLRAIHAALDRDGIVCILVPNWEKVYGANPNIAHLTLWSRRALARALALAHFDVVAIVKGRPVGNAHEWIAVAQRSEEPVGELRLPAPDLDAAAQAWSRGVERFERAQRWQARLGPGYDVAVQTYGGLRSLGSRLWRGRQR